jgi:hypothetical protein
MMLKVHMRPVSGRQRVEPPNAGVVLSPCDVGPEGCDPALLVGTTTDPPLSGPELGIRVLLVASSLSVGPHAPVTTHKSCTLLNAAGVEPQLVACVIHIESVSRSKTAATHR